jgi:hypothetical protein
MPSTTLGSDEEAVAVEPAPGTAAPDAFQPRVRRSRMSPVEIDAEPSAEVRAAERRAARRLFRLYCVACGRSSESPTAPLRPGRCPTCGGTMLLELAVD